jgi:hypothetical protein
VPEGEGNVTTLCELGFAASASSSSVTGNPKVPLKTKSCPSFGTASLTIVRVAGGIEKGPVTVTEAAAVWPLIEAITEPVWTVLPDGSAPVSVVVAPVGGNTEPIWPETNQLASVETQKSSGVPGTPSGP